MRAPRASCDWNLGVRRGQDAVRDGQHAPPPKPTDHTRFENEPRSCHIQHEDQAQELPGENAASQLVRWANFSWNPSVLLSWPFSPHAHTLPVLSPVLTSAPGESGAS